MSLAEPTAPVRPRSPGALSLRVLASRWQGVALTLAIGATTVWLAATGRLILYIHPRYVVFTVVLVVAGMALSVLALAVGAEDAEGHEPDDELDPPRAGMRGASAARRVLATAGVVVAVGVSVSLVVLPPATLSSATAGTRDVGASTLSIGAGSGSPSAGASTAGYTVLDWATRLRQSTSLGDYAGRSVDVTGFVSPSTTDPSDTFVITRFVITCCAVDAQPVGLTVYDPDWRSSLANDEWVRIRGGFGADPAAGSSPIAVVPTAVERIAQPRDPYLY